jgi:hypothetical protein
MSDTPKKPNEKIVQSQHHKTKDQRQKCIQCKNEIPIGAKLCTHCNSYQNRGKNFIKFAAIVVGFVAALGTALFHSLSLYPAVKSYFFPKVEVEVLAYKSPSRLVIANNGDHEIFISHIHYEAEGIPYSKIAQELYSITLNKSLKLIKIKMGAKTDLFDTNQTVEVKIKPGEIITKDPLEGKDIVGMLFIHGKQEKEWHRLILMAGLHRKSPCIRTVFFSPNDRRYKQLLRAFTDPLNTFPARGSIHVFSPRFQKSIAIPIKLVGTVIIRKTDECEEKIERWINPRRGIPLD